MVAGMLGAFSPGCRVRVRGNLLFPLPRSTRRPFLPYHATNLFSSYFSRQAIKKYVSSNNKINVASQATFDAQFNKAIKAGVEKGEFTQPKGKSHSSLSFFLSKFFCPFLFSCPAQPLKSRVHYYVNVHALTSCGWSYSAVASLRNQVTNISRHRTLWPSEAGQEGARCEARR